ncbi:hypothetical protein ACSTS3_04715 [Aquimarina muelleri]|uniref:hypothetical protein n=1 Tax=Aquimarina muelleri TaxID=279356 RepID=UPI003F684DBB
MNLNKNSFSREIGYNQNTTIGRIINEKRNPSEKTLRKIVDRFPVIDYDWLLTGNGKMIVDKEEKELPIFIGKNNDIPIEKIIDIFFLYQEEIENNKRFSKYIESIKKDAIIEYQHTLLTKR